MSDLDGAVIAVPTANREAYCSRSRKAAKVFREHGALRVVESWGVNVPDGEVTSFAMAVKCRPDETAVFCWIMWASREVRDEAMTKVMADSRLQFDVNPMPFDGKRMIFGGFEVMIDE